MPQQEGEDDCGVYVMMVVEAIAEWGQEGRKLMRSEVSGGRMGGWDWGKEMVARMRAEIVKATWLHRV